MTMPFFSFEKVWTETTVVSFKNLTLVVCPYPHSPSIVISRTHLPTLFVTLFSEAWCCLWRKKLIRLIDSVFVNHFMRYVTAEHFDTIVSRKQIYCKVFMAIFYGAFFNECFDFLIYRQRFLTTFWAAFLCDANLDKRVDTVLFGKTIFNGLLGKILDDTFWPAFRYGPFWKIFSPCFAQLSFTIFFWRAPRSGLFSKEIS